MATRYLPRLVDGGPRGDRSGEIFSSKGSGSLPDLPGSAIFTQVWRLATCGALLAACLICDRAGATDLTVACTRLEPEAAEELRARLRLTLREHPRLPASVVVACDAERAWVIWDGPPLEMLPVPAEGEVREAVLDVVESRLRAVRLSNERPTPSPHEVPSWERPEPPPTPTGPRAPTGGLGVGVVAEPLGEPFGLAVGPRLDVGIGWAPFTLVAWESPRFGEREGGDRTLVFSLEAGLAWGAPYVPGYMLGAVLTSGVEWFSIGGTTQATGAATLGLRGALPVGPLWLWLGLDGRTRFDPPAAEDPPGGTLPRFSAALSLGLMLTVEVASPAD
jgi:hypothetical protein